ncbi:MAG TPA: HIT family protein [Roseiarcus sp.]|nr:HIT family protein [Roseiarcus sp.]
MSEFALDPRLAADTFALGDARLSRVLLMNDARFPWLILVPRRADLVEFADLSPDERSLLMEEIVAVSHALSQRQGVEKINVGALGNIVRQLHVHIVGRSRSDAAWPGPVWGFGARRPYQDAAAQQLLRELAQAIARILSDEPGKSG